MKYIKPFFESKQPPKVDLLRSIKGEVEDMMTEISDKNIVCRNSVSTYNKSSMGYIDSINISILSSTTYKSRVRFKASDVIPTIKMIESFIEGYGLKLDVWVENTYSTLTSKQFYSIYNDDAELTDIILYLY